MLEVFHNIVLNLYWSLFYIYIMEINHISMRLNYKKDWGWVLNNTVSIIAEKLIKYNS